MKRLILLATMMVAVLASCEKHEIRNEVLTEIGFTSNVGKQTKTIVDNTTYLTTQPFGVYAYGHQNTTETTIMNNVEVSHTSTTTGEGNDAVTTTKWAATGTTKYYWPNDPSTYINFYAYSPAHGTINPTQGLANDQVLNGDISHSEANGLQLSGYIHKCQTVDFMVADPVMEQKYTTNTTKNGTVNVLFKHQMTQLVFDIVNISYPGVTFTINSVTLSNIRDIATYNFTSSINNQQETIWTGAWSGHDITTGNDNPLGIYNVYTAPASNATGNTVTYTSAEVSGTKFTSTALTVIPQPLVSATKPQTITINYNISGTGVATENNVTATAELYTANLPSWEINKKIKYTISIGMREILFNPEVDNWTEETGSQTVQPVTPSN